jgi:hypothetical protein
MHQDTDIHGAPSTTPTGETGTQDFRDPSSHEGHGRVADAAGVKTIDAEHHFMPGGLDDDPTAEDPYGTAPQSAVVTGIQKTTDGPAYEAGQGTQDMVDNPNSNTNETVDGFADTEGESKVASPDPGTEGGAEPMDPEEYAEAQREARSEEGEQ